MADDNNNNSVNNENMGNQAPHFNKLDNLKNNIASKAATAAGGPMAGKTIDTLNKIRNNPNNNGYVNNKNNRINQVNNNSESNNSSKQNTNRYSSLDKNNYSNKDSLNGSSSNKQSNNPLGGLKNMLGGKNSDKINENDSTATKAVKTVKKVKKALPLIAALAPILMTIIGLIIIVVIIMSQFAAIENFVAEIQVGIEKILNFATGEGWTTNENAFFKRLQEENIKYKSLSSNGESLDLPLIAATIHYDRLVDINTYEKTDAGNETYDSSENNVIVKSDQTASFYGVAGDMLGHVDTIKPGERKLLGHLVKTEITYTEFSADKVKEAGEAWLNYFSQVGVSISNDVCVPGNVICYYQQYLEYVKNTRNYAEQYDNLFAYTEFEILNKLYEAKEFIDSFDKSEDEKDKTSGLFVPKVTRTMDYETYKDYLRNVYIPFHYFNGVKKSDINPLDIENIIDEIFAQKDYYNYLFHSNDNNNTYLAGGGVCSYTVNGVTASDSDIKVELLSCDSTKEHQTVYETIDFNKYIMGVVYAEIDFDEKYSEAMKAQAVAARSYALTINVCTSSNCWLGYNLNTKTIRIRTCEADQVYCDYEKGCTKRYVHVNGFNSRDLLETKSGTNNSGNEVYKYPLSQDKIEKYSSILSDVNGKVVTTTNGSVKNTEYKAGTQTTWKTLNSQGKDYNEMLVKTYGNISVKSECSVSGGAVDGEWANWKQADSRWGGIRIGTNSRGQPVTVSGSGCLLTSLAIQLARSGTVDSNFNPGVFVNKLKQVNGIGSGGGFEGILYLRKAYPQVSSVSGRKDYTGSSTSEIASKIKNDINNGYYIILKVKYSNPTDHWVAVTRVDENNNIYIIDPAGNQKGELLLNSKLNAKYNMFSRKTLTAYYLKF